MDALLVVVISIIAIATTTALAQRLRLAGPLLLVGLGLVIALMPFVSIGEIDPNWILVGVLPPLLYSSAVGLPAIEFRRDFGAIAGLSVMLVLVSALVLGVFFWLVIPSVGLALGVALGAILSPTDAVATSIVKRLGISPRVVVLLEGESLLNDATALVLLRTALIAVAGSFSPALGVGSFAWGVLLALVVGAVVGLVTLRLRQWMRNSAANTAISFTVPFLAYLPTEHFGGSGLVAAVVAGIVTGQGATRWFTPEERMSDELNWRTIELVLEGGVFLVMGLELKDVLTQNLEDHGGLWHGAWLAASALGIVLVVRAGYVSLMVVSQNRRTRRIDRERIEGFSARIEEVAAGPDADTGPARRREPRDPARQERRVAMMRTRVSRLLADFDYYEASPLGWKHGAIIVWAGMRGVVTLAAAQTLPRDDSIQSRALLIFVAFLVAILSLLLQGFSLPWLVRRLELQGSGTEVVSHEEQARLDSELREAAVSALADPSLVKRDGSTFTAGFAEQVGARLTAPPEDRETAQGREILELRLVMVDAMRRRLVDVASDGAYSTAALRHSLAELDADQLSIELRLDDG